MKKIIKFVKQLEINKIIDKLNIDEHYEDDINFDKGLLKFWIYEESEENKEYYVEVYKCEHRKVNNKDVINGIMCYDRTLHNEIVTSEEQAIEIIKNFVKETDYNKQRVEFLQGRIDKLTNDLSNKERCERLPKICKAKTKKLEQFQNDLIIATNFYK